MKPYYKEETFTIYQDSCLDVMDSLEENSIDCIITDPPYEINFMNKGWDNSGIAFNIETWKKALRILKPGGYLLSFNHSRTFHRMVVAIEDAGFEIRDTVLWMYGSGFPKSHNISKAIDKKVGVESEVIGKRKHPTLNNDKEYEAPHHGENKLSTEWDITKPTSYEAKQWDGWGSALKPAYEPITMARKPFKGSLTNNVLENGVGAINIDGCRVGLSENDDKRLGGNGSWKTEGMAKNVYGNYEGKENPSSPLGRFPANIIHDGSDEVVSGFPNTSSGMMKQHIEGGEFNVYGKQYPRDVETIGDSGSASRFFYCAKASKKDRDEGLGKLESKLPAAAEFRPNHMEKALNGEDGEPFGRFSARKNIHPTVKPTELMQYLVRLVSPPNAIILDPFMGSGSTGKAIMFENRERNTNYHFVGIDLDRDDDGKILGYCDISIARIDYALNKYEYDMEELSDLGYGMIQERLDI
jgi:site-specific DNA-methyltransferase (adenine-specific)